MAANRSQPSYDIVIRELIQEQNELQDMMIDILKTVTDTHPEIALKYAGYADKVKQHRK